MGHTSVMVTVHRRMAEGVAVAILSAFPGKRMMLMVGNLPFHNTGIVSFAPDHPLASIPDA